MNYYKDHFLQLYGKETIQISDECIETLIDHDWPGNVRELKNVIERSLVLLSGNGDIDLEQLKVIQKKNAYMSSQGTVVNTIIEILIGTSLEKIEEQVIGQTLNSVDNNKTEAAKILGFTRKTLHNKLDKYRNEE
ncbi:helix-turn-helix domain-containing protein [Fodinibius saliphilus]|uniref:helix-turn-helix domain-containing protein n=1 Tax=Fodinibius saliphilus TaxID=1920650 RepID=UPI001485F41E|nr:helix-turn-helix domain-containing protein [Fodinibius saliphilus]